MLNVIEYGKDEYDFPALLVLGCFDAIHIGHRDLIKKAKLQAKINGLDLGVMLFRDGKGGKTVYSFEERLAILEEYSVKFVLVIDFTEEFKKTSPEDFLHTIEEKVNVKAYMSGKDFRFGAKAKGKSSTLKSYAENEDNGVWYMPVKDVTLDGEKVGTTSVKGFLESGDVAKANELLGEPFYVCGEVKEGAGRGKTIGFPTANIDYPENKFPVKQGVYKVKSEIDGVTYYGIANYGSCPTFGDERIALEVHYEGFDGDLYGRTVKVYFLAYIRDIEAFASADELKAALKKDVLTLSDDGTSDAQGEIAATEDKQAEVTLEEYKNLESGFGDPAEHANGDPAEENAQENAEEQAESEDKN